MRIKGLWTAICLSLLLLVGCSNRDAAQLGSLIGRSLGKPIGTLATAVDETFQTAGDVVSENPRYQQPVQPYQPSTETVNQQQDQQDYYYRTQVLVKTRGPAQIEAVSLQQSEDVSEFWR